MLEYITPDRIANSIMQKADSYEAFLILEGKFDEMLFSKFIDREKCKIEIGFGNENVLEILDLLNGRAFNKSVGVIDSDFRVLDKEKVEVDNIFTTDFHDLEVSVINSDSFQNVMKFHVSDEKLIAKYENYEKLRSHLFSVLKPLSFLKWLNNREKLGLIFKPQNLEGKPLDFSKFICKNNLTFSNIETLIGAILNYCSGKVSIVSKPNDIQKLLNDFISDVELNHLSNGHDIITLMALSLRRHVSNLNSKSISPEQIQRELYLAYEARDFQDTKLYKKIKGWESKRQATVLAF